MTDAYYYPAGGDTEFVATDACGGPWDAAVSHGGPPAALLTRLVERTEAAWPFTVVRIVVEILGPVPVGPVRLAGRVARSGRSVELVEAQLEAGGRVAARARAWRVRATDLSDLPPAAAPPVAVPPLPQVDADPPAGWPGGFIHSLQCRFAAGHWNQLGPATMWARQRVPLVAGEEPSGTQRLMVLADCGSGVSNRLPIADWVFINPELTVHISRQPAGEWLCLDAVTTVDRQGFGLATSALYDETGPVAAAAQSLYVARR